MVLVCKYIFHKNYVGLSIWPFIILKNTALREDVVLMNHERIHLKQQLELLVVPFYILYILEWMVRSVLYVNTYKAYKNISFEREAYENEKNLDYNKNRRPFGFIKYLWC
ncbi:hypothetical protein OO009_15485 [Flavobacteriaceae bacterium KMM 6897]|nr:hypothetical protein [Flavobacteriaceae bacterium KMM 6897]MEB8345752.1 hypothetical protein [Flavobacteriaceae bacterium KMM 6898]